MNGIHDMGGMHGMGPVPYEKDEPVFHAEWEGRVYALTRAMRAWRKWNADTHRHAIETLPPHDYLRLTYYERWYERLLTQVVQYGFVTPQELDNRTAASGTPKVVPALKLSSSAGWLSRGIPPSDAPEIQPLFRVDQRVHTKNIHPAGHTRLPRYARGKTGIIIRDHGVYAFPDTNAHSRGEKRQHLYAVRFTARELWGGTASPRDVVHLDLWDDYLERA